MAAVLNLATGVLAEGGAPPGHPSGPSWDAIAADSGYADQAHLIRDFHQCTGASPTAFLAHPQTHTARPPQPPAFGRASTSSTPVVFVSTRPS
jgi:AraC-like DNA-binding protein